MKQLKRSFVHVLFVAIVLLTAIVSSSLTFGLQASEWVPTTYTYAPADGANQTLRSDWAPRHEIDLVGPESIPAGCYNASIVYGDDHRDQAEGQDFEQVYAYGQVKDTKVFTTAVTPDLPMVPSLPSTEFYTQTANVGEVVLTEEFTGTVIARHGGIGQTGANSVEIVSFELTTCRPAATPTSTTTATATSTPTATNTPTSTPTSTPPADEEPTMYKLYLVWVPAGPRQELPTPSTTPTSPACVQSLTATYLDDGGTPRTLNIGDQWFSDLNDRAGQVQLRAGLELIVNAQTCGEPLNFLGFHPDRAAQLPMGTIQAELVPGATYQYAVPAGAFTIRIVTSGRYGISLENPNVRWPNTPRLEINVQ